MRTASSHPLAGGCRNSSPDQSFRQIGLRGSLEHGLHSALTAARLCDCLGADADTAAQAYYVALPYYVGSTATAATAAEIFGDENALTTYGARSGSGLRRRWWPGCPVLRTGACGGGVTV